MNYYAYVLFFAAFFAGIRSGAAISCYVCNSREDLDGDKCAHISEKSHDLVYNCSNLPEDRGRSERDYTYCRKFIQDVEGDYRVVRSCATGGRIGQCVDRTGTARIKLRYCECENKSPNDPCNIGTLSAPASLLMSLIALCIAGFGLAIFTIPA